MFVPGRGAFQSICELARYCPETADRVYKATCKIVEQAKLHDTFKDFLVALYRFTQEVRAQYTSIGDIWRGQPVISTAQNLVNQQCSAPAPNPVPASDRVLLFEILITPEGKVDRNYKLPGQNDLASPETYQYLDFLLQSWMAKNHIQRQNGIFFAPNADGDMQKMSPNELQAKMQGTTGDPKMQSFIDYVKHETKNAYRIKSITLLQTQAAAQQKTEPGAAPAADSPSSSSSSGH